jgi:hypothetical protein
MSKVTVWKDAKVAYDASVIEKHAAELYQRAFKQVWNNAWFYSLPPITIAILYAMANEQDFSDFDRGVTITFTMLGVVGFFFGFSRGMTIADNLRLQANLALCQVQIERNTAALKSLTTND